MNGGKVIATTGSSTTGATAPCSPRCPTTSPASPRATSTREVHCTHDDRRRRPRAATATTSNVMGQVPPGFKLADARSRSSATRRATREASGAAQRRRLLVGRVRRQQRQLLDDNTGPDGTAASVTGSGDGHAAGPRCPSDCESSMGLGDVVKEARPRSTASRGRAATRDGAHPLCYWFRMPPQPGSGGRGRERAARAPDRASSSPPAATGAALRRRLDGLLDADGRATPQRWGRRPPASPSRSPAAALAADARPPSARRAPTPSRSARSSAARSRRSSQCRDWAGGARDRKLATIADIRNQVNRDDTGIEAPPLSRRRGDGAVRPRVREAATRAASGSTCSTPARPASRRSRASRSDSD